MHTIAKGNVLQAKRSILGKKCKMEKVLIKHVDLWGKF